MGRERSKILLGRKSIREKGRIEKEREWEKRREKKGKENGRESKVKRE